MRRREFMAAISALAAPTKVHRREILTMGDLSRNRHCGEPDAKPLRSAICTGVQNGSSTTSRRSSVPTKTATTTPSHTRSYHGLRFDCDGRSIVAAGIASVIIPGHDNYFLV